MEMSDKQLNVVQEDENEAANVYKYKKSGFTMGKQRYKCKKDRCQFVPILPIAHCLII